ncbi:F-box WD repeat-containing 7 [Brachionus plicatilis]|nr:F-box WD repeat-containing 7 [Brachionus plicatilis]
MENHVECLVFKNLMINISNYSSQQRIIENQKFGCQEILTGHLDSVLCVKKVNENTVVSGGRDNGIMILNIDNPEYTQTFYGHTDSVNCLQIIDEKTLASGSSDKTIRIWNIS